MENTANTAIPKNDDTGNKNVSLRIAHKRPSAEIIAKRKFEVDAWSLLEKHANLLQKYFNSNKECMYELNELCRAHGFFSGNLTIQEIKEGCAI